MYRTAQTARYGARTSRPYAYAHACLYVARPVRPSKLRRVARAVGLVADMLPGALMVFAGFGVIAVGIAQL